MDGVAVPLEKTIEGCKAILSGECDEMPETDFYMIGEVKTTGAAKPAPEEKPEDA